MSAPDSIVQRILDARPAVYRDNHHVAPDVADVITNLLCDASPCPKRHWYSSDYDRRHRRPISVSRAANATGTSWYGEPGVEHYVCAACGGQYCVGELVPEVR